MIDKQIVSILYSKTSFDYLNNAREMFLLQLF